MERAKRLELITLLLQISMSEGIYKIVAAANAAGHAQGQIGKIPSEKLHAWVAEIDEIMCVWPTIGPSLQQGLLAIVRAQRQRSTEQ